MTCASRFLVLPLAVVLASCHRSPLPQPVPDDANARIVLRFLTAYSHRDLEGMMGCLEEEAVFRGSEGVVLTKAQIRAFFQSTFRKHPDLRVDIGPLTVVGGAVHTRVKVQTDVIWTDTWIFEMRNHRIHAYSLASGKR